MARSKKPAPKHAPVKANHWLEILVGAVWALVLAYWLDWLPSFGDSEEAPSSVEES